MELEELFGLPAHPLVVHAAVVLLPFAATGTVVVAAIVRARRWYAPLVFGLALVATIAVALAQQSGESLEDRVTETDLVEEHTEQGETVLPWAIALTVVAGAVVLVGPFRRRLDNVPDRAITTVLLVGALTTAVGATWTVVNVGHSGAKATWSNVEVGDDDDGRDGDDDD
jgi:hypothetical protein